MPKQKTTNNQPQSVKAILRRFCHFLTLVLSLGSWLVLALLLLRFNYQPMPGALEKFIDITCYALMGIYALHALSSLAYLGSRVFQTYELSIKVVILGTLSFTYSHPSLAAGLIILEEVLRDLSKLLKKASVTRLFERLRTQPALLLASSFAVMIMAGSILLSLPIATESGKITFTDALFTAVSATCVTGLVVQDTGTFFTPFGQGVILALIQMGGLGIMTLSTSLALIIGKRLTIRERLFMQNMMEESDYEEFSRILGNVIKMTLISEALGTLILSARFYQVFGEFGKSFYYGLFHSISAFCNAGFSLFSDSLVQFQTDPVINLTISALILVGGLGFTVVYGLYNYQKMPRPRHLNLHLKMTLTVSLLLLILTFLFIFIREYSDAFYAFGFKGKFWASFFQSFTLRTAGFNTVEINSLSTATLLWSMLMMFVGASPGSTGGGIKTTTLGVLFFTIRSMILGRGQVEAFGRSIPWDIVRKSISITFISGATAVIGGIILSLTEGFSLKEILFETTSAVGTVGLSLGITDQLTAAGKLIISSLMYLGRIGPLTVAFLISAEKAQKGFEMPMGKIVVG